PLFTSTPTAPTYPLSLHDALPILLRRFHHRHAPRERRAAPTGEEVVPDGARVADDRAHLVVGDAELVRRDHGERGAQAADVGRADRKSTRLNSSHVSISYAVFCLK